MTASRLNSRDVVKAINLLVAAIAAACGIFIVAMTLRMMVVGWSPAPFWDQWDGIVSGRPLTWSWLFSQQNEHRLFAPRLVFTLDRWLAQETNVFNFIVSVSIQAVLAALLVWLAVRDTRSDWSTKIWAVGVYLALLFWAGQYENFLWGFQVQFFGVVLLSAAAFATVAMGPVTILGAASAIVLSGASLYTLASGILVAPIALVLALWLRRPRWYLSALTIAAIGWPATYLWGYKTPGHHSDPADFFSHSAAVWNHFLVQLGAPFVHATGAQGDLRMAATVGVVVLLAFGGGLVVVLLRPSSPQQKALTALSLFLLGEAFLTALGRVRFGADQALSSRYLTPLVTLWLSILLIWFSATTFWPRLRPLSLVLGAVIAMTAAHSESRLAEAGLNFTLGRKLATPALMAGINDPILTQMFHHPDVVLQERDSLLRFHTSVFTQDWSRLMGAKFADHFSVDDHVQCEGSFRGVQPLDVDLKSWSAHGTALLPSPIRPLRSILLVAGDGRIVGYGLGGFDASSVGDEPDAAIEAPAWWRGDFGSDSPNDVRAYAITGGTVACLIASAPTPSKPHIHLASLPSPQPELAGCIDSVTADESALKIAGWGYLSASQGEVSIDTDLPVRSMTILRTSRPDVARAIGDVSLRNSGFEIRLFGATGFAGGDRHRLCIWTDDPKYGRRTLHDPIRTDLAATFVCGLKAGGGEADAKNGSSSSPK